MAKRNIKPEPELLVVQFLVPKYDRDGKPYSRSIHQNLRKDLEELFDGWSSIGDKPLPGAWRNPESGEIEYDNSWRYEVGFVPDQLQEFDDFLADLAHRLNQKSIWRVVYDGGKGKAIPARRPRGRK